MAKAAALLDPVAAPSPLPVFREFIVYHAEPFHTSTYPGPTPLGPSPPIANASVDTPAPPTAMVALAELRSETSVQLDPFQFSAAAKRV